MKSLSYSELVQFAEFCQKHLQGAQLQSVLTDGQVVVLELYKQGTYQIIFDLHPTLPLIHLLYPDQLTVKKTQKPLTLFLNAHGKNKRLSRVEMDSEKGRLIRFVFVGGETEVLVEAQLIPHAVNLVAIADGKSISWNKPKDLPQGHFVSTVDEISLEPVDWFQEGQLWLEGRGQKSNQVTKKDPKVEIQKSIDKKQKAIGAIEEKLQSNEEDLWRELGESLKISDQVPDHLKEYYDNQLSRGKNRERAFDKAKQVVQKRQGSLDRIEILKKEIEDLKRQLDSPIEVRAKPQVQSHKIKGDEIKSRQLILENGLKAMIGKSAKDNLLLLRQARAWDYWLHLRDYPGAYAIVFREKNQEIKGKEIEKIGQWLIRERLSAKQMNLGVYDILLAECRYIKPVKGSPGLVTYQNEKTYRIKLGGS